MPSDKFAERAREIYYPSCKCSRCKKTRKDIARALERAALEAREEALSGACLKGGLWRATELNKVRARLAKMPEQRGKYAV